MNEKRRLPTSLGVAAPLWAELLKGIALLGVEAPPPPPPPARGRLSLRRLGRACQLRTQADAAGQSLTI